MAARCPRLRSGEPVGLNVKVLGIGLALVVPMIGILAVGFQHDPHYIASPLVGKPAPLFTLTSIDGKELTLAELKGTPVLVNFWATWCVPCESENPELIRAARAWKGKAAFVGVVYQDKPETIRSWLTAHGGTAYPTLVDEGGKVAIAYGVYGVPESFLIDANGVIREKFTGPVTAGKIAAKLAAL